MDIIDGWETAQQSVNAPLCPIALDILSRFYPSSDILESTNVERSKDDFCYNSFQCLRARIFCPSKINGYNVIKQKPQATATWTLYKNDRWILKSRQ